MKVRLNKVTREFSISLNELSDYLYKKYHIEISSPNDTITIEQYEDIKNYYNDYKVYHDVVKKKRINMINRRNNNGEKVTITEHEEEIVKQFEGDDKELKFKSAIEKRMYKKKSKKCPNTSRSKTNWRLSNFKGYIKIVNIPFGGQK